MYPPSISTSEPEAVCAWCGARLVRPEAPISWCAACGAGTTWPRPGAEELEAAYSSWYRPPSGRFSGPGDRLLGRARSRLARRIDERSPVGPVLDVGSGDGTLLGALRAEGREATGIEPHSDRDDTVEGSVAAHPGPWSAVVFWHSLEHLPDAAEAIEHAAGSLAPRGLLVVALPNAASLQAQAFGSRWFALDLPRHLVHLPARALRARLSDLGLTVTRVSHVRGGQIVFGWLHGIVGLLPGSPDLYDAIRRPEARERAVGPGARMATLAAGSLLLPFALVAAGIEVAARRGGTVYVEARKP